MIEENKNRFFGKELLIVILTFVIVSIVKDVEFLFIKTDQTIIADNIFCKLFCIIVILILCKISNFKLSDIGFKNKNVLKYALCGLGLGVLTFAISYGLELLILALQGKSPSLSLYITNFGVAGATNENSLSVLTLLICIGGNIINVLAEEGLFRGFFLKLTTEKYGFTKANFIQAFLFGIWHIITVVLAVVEGSMTIPMAILFAIGYIILAGILGLEWGTCVNMTGVLWVGIFEHFFNNFIGNILHVISSTGADELQIVRIVLSNVLSLTIVLMINKIQKKKYRK